VVDRTLTRGGTPSIRPEHDPRALAALVVIASPARSLLGRRRPLDGPVLLGRDPSCDLVLDLDDVSRHHARILPEGTGHVLTDLGSTNGTFVGDERVTRRVLRAGDLLRVGSALVRYLAAGDPESAYHDELARRAREDALTCLPNRATFDEAIAEAFATSRRHGAPLAVLVLDIDHFKGVNDRHGHAAGDLVLRELARLLAPLVRGAELLARVGGEELAVVLPGADRAAALAAGERMRAAVAAHEFRFGGERVPVTLSAGAAVLEPGDADGPALLARADAALYSAKASGRDAVRG
jgi:two-component system cell cycle response regulator